MSLSQKLDTWYTDFGRTLPWRGIDDPYRIWLSEIILQQTRIEQGRDYYHRFVEAFPTVSDLAAASEEQVLRLWQGLGYYSRARNLHAAAQSIMNECNGVFPSDYEGVLKLKGVGRYTAAAIASFAFRLPHPVIDGNALRTGRVAMLPVKAAKNKPTDRWFYYFHLHWRSNGVEHTLVEQREGKDIWRGLYQFPLLEADKELNDKRLMEEATRFLRENFQFPVTDFRLSPPFRHQLTHRTIHALFLEAELPSEPASTTEKYRAIPFLEIKNIPVSRLIDRYLQTL